jgi:predicted GNAT family N-acyltransferase
MTLNITLGSWASLEQAVAPIRLAVFVEEQAVPVDLEWDEFDAPSLHALALWDTTPIGTARLLPDGHIGRLAVLPAWRGRGVGAALMEAMIEAARKAGHACLVLHAQTHALSFYQRFGFTPEGECFMEAGILHQKMVRALGAV